MEGKELTEVWDRKTECTGRVKRFLPHPVYDKYYCFGCSSLYFR